MVDFYNYYSYRLEPFVFSLLSFVFFEVYELNRLEVEFGEAKKNQKIKAADNFRAHFFLYAHALQLVRFAHSNSNAY